MNRPPRMRTSMNRWPFGHASRKTIGIPTVHPINVTAADLYRGLTIVPTAKADTTPMATTDHVCARCQYRTKKQGIHNSIAAAPPDAERFNSSPCNSAHLPGHSAHRYQSQKGSMTSQYQLTLGYRSSTRPCPASAAMKRPDTTRCP